MMGVRSFIDWYTRDDPPWMQAVLRYWIYLMLALLAADVAIVVGLAWRAAYQAGYR